MITLQELLFNLLNLGMVILALLYVVINYLIPQLKNKIVADHRDFVELHEEHTRLTHEQESLEYAIVVQEDHAKKLFKKINQWKNLVEVAAQAELVAREQIRKKSEERKAQSARNYLLHKTYDTVAPMVAKTLEQDFMKKFADPQEGHAYLAQVLKKLSV